MKYNESIRYGVLKLKGELAATPQAFFRHSLLSSSYEKGNNNNGMVCHETIDIDTLSNAIIKRAKLFSDHFTRRKKVKSATSWYLESINEHEYSMIMLTILNIIIEKSNENKEA